MSTEIFTGVTNCHVTSMEQVPELTRAGTMRGADLHVFRFSATLHAFIVRYRGGLGGLFTLQNIKYFHCALL